LALARYAGLCQEAGLVPIVEPEVLMDGAHDLKRCFWATDAALHAVFDALHAQRVDLGAILLKPNMVLPGRDCRDQVGDETAAVATVRCLLGSVPAAVPGIAFLSGGQDSDLATLRLAAMNRIFKGRLPWRLTFSYARAIQDPVLGIWRGEPVNRCRAQEALLARAEANGAASHGA
jgi:fructose-bisphosphate aldolase class I